MYIKKFSVKNYRSLETVNVSDLSPQMVFFGDNDTGKSNVLSFLELLFQRKYTIDPTKTSTDTREGKMLCDFWLGYIDEFSDNFYYENNGPISFSVVISYGDDELDVLPGAVKDPKQENALRISGLIRRTEFHDRAEMILQKVELNSKEIFDGGKQDSEKYLPEFGLSQSEIIQVFEKLMSPLNDSFLRIPADRFIKQEFENKEEQEIKLSAEIFKNWLFSINLDRDKEKTYQDIIQQFSSPPFKKGRLSLARIKGNHLEIFVEDQNGHKLPIGSKGTGVQQVLIILAYLAQSKSRFVGIEELEVNLSPQAQKSIFDTIINLIQQPRTRVSQVFLITHSQIIASRQVPGVVIEKRQVTIKDGKTSIQKPTDENLTDFFNPL